MVQFDMDEFRWSRESTPLAHPAFPVAGMLLYLATVFTLKRAVKTPVRIPIAVAAVHNLILCLGSLAMFVGTLQALWQVRGFRGHAPELLPLHMHSTTACILPESTNFRGLQPCPVRCKTVAKPSLRQSLLRAPDA